AVGRQVQTGQLPTQAVVDEAIGQRQQEITLQGGLGPLDVEAVVQETVENGLADGGVVIGLGRHVQGPGTEVLATGTACAVLCISDLQPGDPAVSQGANTA